MATIDAAVSKGILHEFGLPSHEGREPRRRLLLASEVYDWVEKNERLFDHAYGKGGRTLFEHFEQGLCDFRCDRRPAAGELNRVMPTKKGVWKLQPYGVRLFGWVPKQHEFVGVIAALATDTHGPNSLVDDCVQAVLQFAKFNGLSQTIMRGDRIALFPTQA